jgi:uncharacterized protein
MISRADHLPGEGRRIVSSSVIARRRGSLAAIVARRRAAYAGSVIWNSSRKEPPSKASIDEYTSMAMTLWIDADAAPRDVKDICIRACDRLALKTVLVANQRMQLPLGYPNLSAVRVEGGPDVADRYIAEHAVAGDVAVTADIPLAALLVPKGVVVLDPRGDEYTEESIGERLSVRNFMDGLRGIGVETGGHAPYGQREKQAFANALDRALTRAAKTR